MVLHIISNFTLYTAIKYRQIQRFFAVIVVVVGSTRL
jgi:hypothetical protein